MPHRIRALLVLLFTVGVISFAAAWQASQPEQAELLPVLRGPAQKYWKGNLHTHSLWSDGDDFPEMIADWYKRNDYNFLALTEHNVLAEGQRWIDEAKHKVALKKYLTRFGPSWVEQREEGGKAQVRLKPLLEFRSLLDEPGRFLLVQGEEITHKFAKAPVHMNAINLRDVIKPTDGGNVTETIQVNHRAVFEQRKKATRDMFVFLNHPNFGWGVRAEDMVPAEELRYFEVFNGHPGVRNYGDGMHASCERMWDIVLSLRLGKYSLPILYGLATDDAHRYHEWGVGKVNPGRGWLMVQAPYLTPEAIVKNIESGNFYASSGVRLKSISRADGRLTIIIDSEEKVEYKTEFIATMKDASLDSTPTKDMDGKSLDVTRTYSADIGKVVAETAQLTATYPFTGNELYVRARVTSTRPHPNPYEKGDVERAWIQPVQPLTPP